MRMINYAHRGASEYYPENTLRSFYAGLEMGATGMETDIQRTKDGVLVLHHDDTLTERRILELLADLRGRLDALSEPYGDAPAVDGDYAFRPVEDRAPRAERIVLQDDAVRKHELHAELAAPAVERIRGVRLIGADDLHGA